MKIGIVLVAVVMMAVASTPAATAQGVGSKFRARKAPAAKRSRPGPQPGISRPAAPRPAPRAPRRPLTPVEPTFTDPSGRVDKSGRPVRSYPAVRGNVSGARR